jgi:pimeloyl-ACP methyl ester carboxylesterase
MPQVNVNGTLVVIGDAGHMSPMEQPQLVTAAIRQFLAQI